MEDRRAQTLQALSAFIQTQKALLTRTQNDIERLKELRSKAVAQPSEILGDLEEEVRSRRSRRHGRLTKFLPQLDNSAYRLSEQGDCYPQVPKDISWSLYANHDPAPFHNLHTQHIPPQPPFTPKSTISDVQQYVKNAKASILEPVFAKLDLSFDPPPPEPTEDPKSEPSEAPDSTAIKKRTKERIKEQRKLKNISCVTISGNGPSRGRGGLFIRKDKNQDLLNENNMAVDIEPQQSPSPQTPITPYSVTSTLPPASPCVTPIIPMALSKTSRVRRRTIKASDPYKKSSAVPSHQSTPTLVSTRTRRQSRSSQVDNEDMQMDTRMDVDPPVIIQSHSPVGSVGDAHPHDADDSMSIAFSEASTYASASSASASASTRRSPTPTVELPKPKPRGPVIIIPSKNDRLALAANGAVPGRLKPETYKQAWTSEEQHLLEKLLEEIPEGEKNRWKKISHAMNGRRTPRQVASRVQKYFEKLKRFGLD
ncbi:hypothetical protein D9758_005157 [Tetrapyrgos nigripes]|uniref:Uncharacterized protein n=1 Tax=Tetrapyrgos nigripes TaxID=182062 RepID=A0A8H5GWX6_9AGAR|nr:hypothetical protein D9758_005157 [Tetrapyrgos nigripes]